VPRGLRGHILAKASFIHHHKSSISFSSCRNIEKDCVHKWLDPVQPGCPLAYSSIGLVVNELGFLFSFCMSGQIVKRKERKNHTLASIVVYPGYV
jgi:hypothetical protein